MELIRLGETDRGGKGRTNMKQLDPHKEELNKKAKVFDSRKILVEIFVLPVNWNASIHN